MDELILIKPFSPKSDSTERLDFILERCLKKYDYDVITTAEQLGKGNVAGKRLLFAVPIGEVGINLEYYRIIETLRGKNDCLSECFGAVITDGKSELYTKSVARELALCANMAGCTFVGKSLVEGAGALKNYNVIAKNLSSDNTTAYVVSAEMLVDALMNFKQPVKNCPRVLMIHAGSREKSNTIMLWDMVRKHLRGISVNEISLQDGEIKDCIGCPYVTCLHYGEQESCFYGGIITEKVYPAILSCDVLVIASPNYNDAVPAYISAFINRLTSLVRVNQLSEKQLFAVVVSGYSGGDLVAMQLIGALNMNKPFILPARFAFFGTANETGEIKQTPDIDKMAEEFAQNMLKQIKK